MMLMRKANNNSSSSTSLLTMESSSVSCGRKRRHDDMMTERGGDASDHQRYQHQEARSNALVLCRSSSDAPCYRRSTIIIAGFNRHVMFALLLCIMWVQILPTARAEEESIPIPHLQTLRDNLPIMTPPEEDVTPFPTASVVTTPPAPLPTPIPTFTPTTSRPSPSPTARPSTSKPSLAPTTSTPSLAPFPAPTAQPSFVPSTLDPTSIPTVQPSTAVPSPAPSEQPSFSPLAPGETRAPSPEPTAAPSMQPSFAPSISSTELSQPPSPTRLSTVDRTLSPTTVWQPISIARSARVTLELPPGQRASPIGLANIWQSYTEDALQQTVESSGGSLRIIDILVLVDGESAANPSSNNNQRHLRFLQGQGDTVSQTFKIDTTVEMERNATDPNTGPDLENQIDEQVGSLLSADNLQGALEDAGVEGVRVVEAVEVDPSSGRPVKEKPEQWELILGFGLVGICAALLAFTLYSRIKSWQKRRKKRRLAKSRQQNSYIMPKQKRPVPVSTTPERSRVADISTKEPPAGPTMYAVQEDSTYLRKIPTIGTSDESSDPFADELKYAVVVDKEAWNEQQKQKEQMRKRGLVVNSLYSAAGSGEEGVEVGALGVAGTSYPYGEEKQSMSPSSRSSAPTPVQSPAMAQQQLSPENAVTWTAAGVALGMLGQRRASEDKSVSGFEPYGESKKDSDLRDSWDASDIPDEEFGVYSFMNPLRPRSNDSGNAGDSPDSFSRSEDPSSVAVGASMSASSWTETDAADPRASPTEKMIPLGMIEEAASEANSEPGDKTADDSFATEAMLDEVERLSAYVKRYEKKKEVQKGSTSGSSVPYDAMSDSVSARRAGGDPNYQQTLSMNNTSMESSGIGNLESASDLSMVATYSEDDASTRLGIKRFNIQEVSQSALQYNVEELPIPSVASPQEGNNSHLLSVSGISMDISHNMPNAPDRPHSPASDIPEDEVSGKLEVSRSANRKLDAKMNRGKLNKLRGTGNMLDGESSRSSTVPFDEPNRRAAVSKPSERATNRTPPKIRSNNRGFTSIVSMFESKPKNPVTPPRADWQHSVKTGKK